MSSPFLPYKIFAGLFFAGWAIMPGGMAKVHAQGAIARSVQQTQQGMAALQRGNYKLASAAYSNALNLGELSPRRRASILSDRGVARWRMKQVQAALSDFSEALRLNPDYAQAYNNRGSLLLQLGKIEPAIKDFTAAINISPDYGVAYNNRANAYFEKGEFEKAGWDYRRAMRMLPSNAIPFNGHGQASLALARQYEARRDFTRAIRLNKKYGTAYLNRAVVHTDIKEYADAEKDYSEVIKVIANSPDLYLKRAFVRLRRKKVYPAINDLNKVLELAPELAEAYIYRGEAWGKLKKYDKAFEDIEKAIQINPDNVEAFATRAQLYYKRRNYDAAITDLKTAIELKPGHAASLTLLGRIEEKRKNNEAALAYYRQALKSEIDYRGARAGIKRITGELPSLAQNPLGEPLSGWIISEPEEGKYFLTNDAYPYFRVPLEMYGEGKPVLLEWTRLKRPLRGFGLMRFFAGIDPLNGKEELEFIAILDLRNNRLVGIEPFKRGTKTSIWSWRRVSVLVTDPDGLANEVFLKSPSKTDVSNYEQGNLGKSASAKRRAARRAKRRERRRRRKQKSIFDRIF